MCAAWAKATASDGRRYCLECLIDCAPREYPEHRPPKRCAECSCGPERIREGEHGILYSHSTGLEEITPGEWICAGCRADRELASEIERPQSHAGIDLSEVALSILWRAR
jgi:hypothetical protein